MDKQDKIQHFGVWIKKSDKNRISRDTYAVIDKKSSTWYSKRKLLYKTTEKRQLYFDDEECRIYSDSFCEEWQEKCLINFDKNIEFFKQIPKDKFETALQKLIGSNKNVRQIFDLNDCKGMCGIYIMVLDEYKQVYIGQSQNIKHRIMQHWSARKEFDRLLWGGVNHSVISIDSFGALDTTRIFVLETSLLDSVERLAVSKMPSSLKLNRIGGGTISDNLDLLIALGEWNLRSLQDCHSEEHAEKYDEEVDVTYFVSAEYCDTHEISAGDIICVEQIEKGAAVSVKCYGKVIKINKTVLLLSQYCGPTIGNSCYSSEFDFKDKRKLVSSYREFRIKKTLRFAKVNMIEKKEIHTFWRSKKFPNLEA